MQNILSVTNTLPLLFLPIMSIICCSRIFEPTLLTTSTCCDLICVIARSVLLASIEKIVSQKEKHISAYVTSSLFLLFSCFVSSNNSSKPCAKKSAAAKMPKKLTSMPLTLYSISTRSFPFFANCLTLYLGNGSLGTISVRANRLMQLPIAISRVSLKTRYC